MSDSVTAAHQAPLSSILFQNLLKFTSIELVMLTISSSATQFSFCLQPFPAWSFPVSWLFTSGGQCIGASASPCSNPSIRLFCIHCRAYRKQVKSSDLLTLSSSQNMKHKAIPREVTGLTLLKNQRKF